MKEIIDLIDSLWINLVYPNYFYSVIFLIFLAFIFIKSTLLLNTYLKTKKIYSFLSFITFNISKFFIYLLSILFYFLLFSNFSIFDFSYNYSSLFFCLFLMDILFYWKHRMSHEWRFLWIEHIVHHTPKIFNQKVAFKSGLFDPAISFVFFLPLVLLGFHPAILFLSGMIGKIYQFIIHTDSIKELSFLEYIFNTPSKHRVHHGTNEQYIDKNYGNILIIWDILFGTYQKENQKPSYGILNLEKYPSSHYIKIWEYSWRSLIRELKSSKLNLVNTYKILFSYPK